MSDGFLKKPHMEGCTGRLHRLPDTVCADVTGRIGNGGWVFHDYRCNVEWAGCPARVIVAEWYMRRFAVELEERPS